MNRSAIDRRRFLIGTMAAGVTGAATAAIHDGELGAAPQTGNQQPKYGVSYHRRLPDSVPRGIVFAGIGERLYKIKPRR